MDALTHVVGGGPVHIEYIDLNGVVGIFVKLDATNVDENVVDTVQMALGHQIRLLVQANREGTPLQKESYVRSLDKMKKGRPVQCRYCEEVYHCRPDLATHQSKMHPAFPVRAGRRPRRPCPQCGKMVLNLSLHIRNKHEQDPIVLQQGMAQCRQCGETYPQETDHKSVCRLSPVCPDCNKSFSQWRVMNKHRRIVHMGIKISCPNCGKNYHDSQSLKKHIDAVHLKIKRLCPLCGASVTALAVHMNSVHTGAKNFGCQDCGKKFKSNYDLNRHRDTVHLGNKPVCPFCGKHLANIRQHIRVVHKQIRFPCSVCKKQMTTKAELRKHFSKAHYNMDPGIDARNNQNPEHMVLQQPPMQQQEIPQEQTKELSEEQLLAQYFGGRQQFQLQANKPEDVGHLLTKNEVLDENHLVVIKPDLDHLMAVRTHHPQQQQQTNTINPINKLDVVVDALPPQTHLPKSDLDLELMAPSRPQQSLDHLLSHRPNHIDHLLGGRGPNSDQLLGGRGNYPVHMAPVTLTHQPNVQPLWTGLQPNTHQVDPGRIHLHKLKQNM